MSFPFRGCFCPVLLSVCLHITGSQVNPQFTCVRRSVGVLFHPLEENKKLNFKVTLPQIVNSFSLCVCIYICIWNILIILLNFLFHGAISVASSRHCWRPLILTQDKWSTIRGCHPAQGGQIPQSFTLTPESPLHGLLLVPVSHSSKTGPSCELLCLKAVPLCFSFACYFNKRLAILTSGFYFPDRGRFEKPCSVWPHEGLQGWAGNLVTTSRWGWGTFPGCRKEPNDSVILSQHLSWELRISVGINHFGSLLTNIASHLGLIFGVQASLSSLLLSPKNNNKYNKYP